MSGYAEAMSCGGEWHPLTRNASSRELLGLASEFAVALDQGGFEVHFQPVSSAQSRRVAGVEALARWRRPDGTLVLPSAFIAAAEHGGLSQALTSKVLEISLGALQAWTSAGHALHLAVNTTVADLLDMGFAGRVARALEVNEIAPEMLVLEVTETAVMTDPARIGLVLAELCSLGVELSLDDFGTGYSSLAHLRELPVSEIKIDRSFVTGMRHDPTDAAIVFAMIGLAHKLGIRVVAEGVEDEETWEALQRQGCELIQGYVISRPVEAAELERQLASPRRCGAINGALRAVGRRRVACL